MKPLPPTYLREELQRDSLGHWPDGLSIGAETHEQLEAGVTRLDDRHSALQKIYALRRRKGQMPPEEPARSKLSINWKLLVAIFIVAFLLKKFFNF